MGDGLYILSRIMGAPLLIALLTAFAAHTYRFTGFKMKKFRIKKVHISWTDNSYIRTFILALVVERKT